MADPLAQPADSLAALERVVSEAEAYLASLSTGPVRLPSSNEAAETFDGRLPEDGLGTLAALDELIQRGLDAHVRSSGPRFFHWVMGGATPAALGADWLTSLLDQNAGGWDASPLAARLELVGLRWLRELFALPAEWDGVLVTGGQMANFTGLAAARQWCGERHGVDVSVDGLAGLPPIPVLSSGFIHVTGRKALAMLGLGPGRLTTCADGDGAMDLAALERELRSLDGAPAIVIGNAGEVNTGLFDPIERIADLCKRYGAWLHVDGAFGLFARVSPRTAELAAGVERAQSVIADGHKWLNVPFDCGFAFVQDPEILGRTFAAGAAYLPEAAEDRPIFAFRAPELSRRARSLAVWATLAAYGRNGYRAIVERCVDNAARLAAQVEESDDFELLAPAPLNVVCMRYRPPGVAEPELDDLNQRIAEAVLTDGRVYVGTTSWQGKVAFRPAFVNWRTTSDDVDLILETLRDLGTRPA
ncbi:MAG TPA: pyridoxal-dependent decarboxylase [Gaiellaceae bacterium]|nr:pyridoxal-dependent decarboxylase [Gaiellaceae bacterium]